MSSLKNKLTKMEILSGGLTVALLIVVVITLGLMKNQLPFENNLALVSFCPQYASISVKTDKIDKIYKTGEVLDGDIVFTNALSSEGAVTFLGKMYKGINQFILESQTITAVMKPGQNKYRISDLFGNIVIPMGYNGPFKVEVTSSAIGCTWKAEDSFSVKNQSVCEITANTNVHEDTYTFGETITGEISINNKGPQVPADLAVKLYKGGILFWSREANLPIQPGESKFDLNTAFGFVPTIPADSNLLGDWKLEFTLKSDVCDLKVSDGFEISNEQPIACGNYVCEDGETASSCWDDCGTINGVEDYFDMEKIKALTLEELQWKEESREVLGDGRIIIKGSYKTPLWTSITEGNLEKLRQDLLYDEFDVVMEHPVVLYLPTNISSKKIGVTDSVQIEELLDSPFYSVVSSGVAMKYGVPYLLHANKNELFANKEINKELDASMYHYMYLNSTSPKAQKVNMLYFLLQKNLYANTLLQRLCERENKPIDSIISRGGSKQGAGVNLQAMVDDRNVLIIPAANPMKDFSFATNQLLKNQFNNCQFMLMRGMPFWEFAAGESVVSKNLRKAVDITTNMKNGGSYYPEMTIFSGSVGVKGTHDSLFPLSADTVFLSSEIVKNINSRYIRSDKEDDFLGSLTSYELPVALEYGLYGTPWIKLTDFNYTFDDITNTLTASCKIEDGSQNAKVSLVYGLSDNRRWDDETVESWHEVPVQCVGSNCQISYKFPNDYEIAWYIQAVDSKKSSVDDNDDVVFSDATPIILKNKFPTCQACGDYNCYLDVSVKIAKSEYRLGEKILGDLIFRSNYGESGKVEAKLELTNEGIVYWSRSENIDLPNGQTIITLRDTLSPSIPSYGSFSKDWVLRLSVKAGNYQWSDEVKFIVN